MRRIDPLILLSIIIALMNVYEVSFYDGNSNNFDLKNLLNYLTVPENVNEFVSLDNNLLETVSKYNKERIDTLGKLDPKNELSLDDERKFFNRLEELDLKDKKLFDLIYEKLQMGSVREMLRNVHNERMFHKNFYRELFKKEKRKDPNLKEREEFYQDYMENTKDSNERNIELIEAILKDLHKVGE